ncbi:MAG: CHAD domain-containing protein [Novosphingobium sp.]|nr:CHAD domain-containing protein [Novosphingobium sp.]MCP5379420.1 CHAD domain-containing protein [Novosphingobium sp.]MCP5388507.1 CHAD domain-containing protein [Novosphingobium sp.]
MAYRIAGDDRSVEQAVRRIAREQIGKAIRSIDRRDQAHAVHDVRRRCKKLRALVRMVRPAFPGYARENAAFRDIARIISGSRDARVMLATHDLLAAELGKGHDRRALGAVRRRLTLQRKAEAALADPSAFLDLCRAQLVEARERAQAWEVSADGWAAIGPGVARTFDRLHRDWCRANTAPDAEAYHMARKQVKYHGFHTRLLSPLWPEAMTVRLEVAEQLGEMLGLHHDLWVFESRLAADAQSFGNASAVDALLSLARLKRAGIEDASRVLADRLRSETPPALAERWGALWAGWQCEPISRS